MVKGNPNRAHGSRSIESITRRARVNYRRDRPRAAGAQLLTMPVTAAASSVVSVQPASVWNQK
jgi:hypothetical protein